MAKDYRDVTYVPFANESSCVEPAGRPVGSAEPAGGKPAFEGERGCGPDSASAKPP